MPKIFIRLTCQVPVYFFFSINHPMQLQPVAIPSFLGNKRNSLCSRIRSIFIPRLHTCFLACVFKS